MKVCRRGMDRKNCEVEPEIYFAQNKKLKKSDKTIRSKKKFKKNVILLVNILLPWQEWCVPKVCMPQPYASSPQVIPGALIQIYVRVILFDCIVSYITV